MASPHFGPLRITVTNINLSRLRSQRRFRRSGKRLLMLLPLLVCCADISSGRSQMPNSSPSVSTRPIVMDRAGAKPTASEKVVANEHRGVDEKNQASESRKRDDLVGTSRQEFIKYENKNQVDPRPIFVSAISGRTIAEAGETGAARDLGPVTGARVGLFTEEGHHLVHSSAVDHEGRFQLQTVPAGKYRLVVRVDWLCVANVPLEVVEGSAIEDPKEIVVHLRPRGIDSCSYANVVSTRTREVARDESDYAPLNQMAVMRRAEVASSQPASKVLTSKTSLRMSRPTAANARFPMNTEGSKLRASETAMGQPRVVRILRFEVDRKVVRQPFKILLNANRKLVIPRIVKHGFVVPAGIEKYESVDVRFRSGKYDLLFAGISPAKFMDDWIVGVDTKPFDPDNVSSEQAKRTQEIHFIDFESHVSDGTRVIVKVHKTPGQNGRVVPGFLADQSMPVLNLCELVSNWKDFNRQKVRVRSILRVGAEQTWLYDPMCRNGEALTDVEFQKGLTGTTKKLDQILDQDKKASVILEGIFYGPELHQNVDPKLPARTRELLEKSPRRYGHLDSFETMFDVTRVLDAVQVSSVPDSDQSFLLQTLPRAATKNLKADYSQRVGVERPSNTELIFEGTVLKVGDRPQFSCGVMAVYRLASYRVDRVLAGEYKDAEIVVDYLTCELDPLEGVKPGDKVTVIAYRRPTILQRWNAQGIRSSSDPVETFYVAKRLTPPSGIATIERSRVEPYDSADNAHKSFRVLAGNLSEPPAEFSVLSQRPLTETELEQFEDALGLTIAVRLRLKNESNQPLYYFAQKDSILPEGYQLFREVGRGAWQSLPPRRASGRLPEVNKEDYTWLELPPGAAREFEAMDWSKPDEEHAFSTFIKTSLTGDRPVEVISNAFRPENAAVDQAVSDNPASHKIPGREKTPAQTVLLFNMKTHENVACSQSALMVEASLTNASSDSVAIDTVGVRYEIDFEKVATLSTGGSVQSMTKRGDYGPGLVNERTFRVLKAGETYRTSFKLPLSEKFFNDQGNYEIRATYGQFHKSEFQGVPLFKGTVASNETEFSIVSCSSKKAKKSLTTMAARQ